jgi:hypothetical protein
MQVVYTANNFQSSDTANLKLALAVNEQSCGIALHTSEGQLQYLGYYNFLEPLKDNETLFFDFIRSQEILKQKKNDISIILNCPKSTLVPKELYDELYIDSYLRHLYNESKDEVVKALNVVKGDEGVFMVFSVQEHLYYPARSKYYDAVIEPNCANYLRKSMKHFHNKLNVFFEDKTMFIIHASNSKPEFFNAFQYESVEEAAYFILNYYQTFDIQHQSLPIVLHGDVHPQLKEMLNNYSGKSEFAEPVNKNIDIPKGFAYSFLIDYTY